MAKKKEPVPLNRNPEYMANLGRSGGEATKKLKPKNYFSKLAKQSHPRKEYKGGRPLGSTKKPKPEPVAQEEAPA